MRTDLHIKKGLDLHIAGGVDDMTPRRVSPATVAVVPDDFPGFTPKLDVKEGDAVKQGQPLMHDKATPHIVLVAPVAGTVAAVVRGARRKIERVVITPAAGGESVTVEGSVVERLMRSGLWAMMRQRPFDIVPVPGVRPRAIFVTGFDSAPLAAPMEADEADIAAGAKALAELTDTVYLCGRPGEMPEVDGAVTVDVTGPHPAGNPGVQAANIAPVSKGEMVWTLDVITLARIGRLMATGRVDTSARVAVTGSQVTAPCIVDTVMGADIASLTAGNLKEGHNRIISGNVLTGANVGVDGYLRYPYRQVTVIPEGDDADEFLGWASLSPKKMSESRSFPGHFLRSRLFKPDARINGGRRAMIMSGRYDKVLPMPILPEYLFKAIIARDINRMEQLGIYEIAPEDVALCEYVDPSKLELQKLVREGLDYLRREDA